MNENQLLIEKFYNSFQALDHAGMNSCYDDDIVFFDPVFLLLRGEDVKSMWQMLCTNAKDFSLTYSDIIHLDEEYSICKWTATYTFSKTGRKVTNHIMANMRFANGKIIEHSDGFGLYKWNRQAFGLTGTLLGWTSFFQKKVRKQARKNLEKFILANINFA